MQPRHLDFQKQTNKMKPNKHLIEFCPDFPSLQSWFLTDREGGGEVISSSPKALKGEVALSPEGGRVVKEERN